MRGRCAHQAVLGILLVWLASACLGTEIPDANESSKYLNAVREFADNVLKYGRDTYGTKHTPLFVDGLNVHTREPVKWITMKWYDAGKVPPQELADGQPLPHSGSLLIGDEGTMYIPDTWGRKWKLLPKEKFADYKPPEPTIRRAGDPYIEWITTCKGGPPALSQFDYSAVLTETVLLGIIAVRVGKRIEWDAENMKARSTPEAEAFVKREYRKGWTL